jgi:hypothetical protein
VRLVLSLREAHGLCDEHGDVATASLIENWIDEAEGRGWFLFEATRDVARVDSFWIFAALTLSRLFLVLIMKRSWLKWALTLVRVNS